MVIMCNARACLFPDLDGVAGEGLAAMSQSCVYAAARSSTCFLPSSSSSPCKPLRLKMMESHRLHLQ